LNLDNRNDGHVKKSAINVIYDTISSDLESQSCSRENATSDGCMNSPGHVSNCTCARRGFLSALGLASFSVSQPGARAGPRDGTKALIGALLKQQIDSKPHSRIGRLATRVDVLRLVANAPFPS
jgi:hypothetical protein